MYKYVLQGFLMIIMIFHSSCPSNNDNSLALFFFFNCSPRLWHSVQRIECQQEIHMHSLKLGEGPFHLFLGCKRTKWSHLIISFPPSKGVWHSASRRCLRRGPEFSSIKTFWWAIVIRGRPPGRRRVPLIVRWGCRGRQIPTQEKGSFQSGLYMHGEEWSRPSAKEPPNSQVK